MGLSQVEKVMGRRQLDALIRSDPVEIILKRRPKLSVPGGGWRYGAEVSLVPQVVTIVPFKRRMTEFLVNTELGDLPDLPYIILGYPTLDILRDDTFYWQGDLFKVETIDLKREVRVAAHVDYFGGTTNA